MPPVGRIGTSIRRSARSLHSRLQGGRPIVPFALASHTSSIVGSDFGSLSDPDLSSTVCDFESEGWGTEALALSHRNRSKTSASKVIMSFVARARARKIVLFA